MFSSQLIFTVVLAISVCSFLFSCHRRLQLVTRGASEDRFDRPAARLFAMLSYAFAQRRVLSRPYGMNHFLLFWAFLCLLVANGEFLLEGVLPGAGLAAVVPAAGYRMLTVLFDFVSLLALGAVLVAFARRLLFPPKYLGNDYTRPVSGEALLILGMIAALMIAFFLLNAARISMGTGDGVRPISAAIAQLLQRQSLPVLKNLATAAWWTHALLLLLFMNVLPRSKHMHILTAIPNCYFQSLEKPNTQPREVFAKGARYGVASVEQYTWKDLLDAFTCTECGRCQDNCPAHNTGKPLNPRRIVHDIKTNLLRNAQALRHGGKGPLALIGEAGEGAVSKDAVWSCTTCGACTSVCPVMIEQMPKILKLRRHLVQEQADFPEELLNLFENMEQRSNPWGIAPSERSKWSSLLGDRSFKPGETEYLFFVGCAGAFDSRNKQVTVALATILDKAGVSWGILGKEELCCGDSVRRLGNEYVFDRMARENVALLQEKKVAKIVTQCPHCFSTLKNDYRQYGLELEVLHHTELIAGLLSSGKLKLNGKVTELGHMLFHDPCYLGRHNDVYRAPREAIRRVTGKAPAEFARSGKESFCCGAGGGRMWQEETQGERINLSRVKQALEEKPDTICVSCPYCMTMMEDGIKDLRIDATKVRDLAEVVAEGLR